MHVCTSVVFRSFYEELRDYRLSPHPAVAVRLPPGDFPVPNEEEWGSGGDRWRNADEFHLHNRMFHECVSVHVIQK